MGFLQILIFIIFGAVLLWFGFNLFLGQWARIKACSGPGELPAGGCVPEKDPVHKREIAPDDPQSCPICSIKLKRGELVETHAFPSITGGKDRLMHVIGCAYCIEGALKRKCPVCGSPLHPSEFLVARLFERTHTRNHVHILGCVHCRKSGSS